MTEATQVMLDNGLKILLKEIHTAPIISHWLWYRVGSKDEPTGKTGTSHWVEHMQFKGTPQFPASMLDKAVSREGGTWNAFTFVDWTTYYETMPAAKIDLALRLEADRMVNSTFDPAEVESERTVILSEREGNENEPLFLLGEAIQAACFRVHPYHHEVIGDTADLHTLSAADLRQHYQNYYIPNNAVLALAGDFDTAEMLARLTELYSPIPAGSPPPRLDRPEPPRRGEMRLNVNGPGEATYLQAAYPSVPGAHPDFYPLAVLDSLLAGPSNLNMFGGGGVSNRTSRLYHALVEKELAVGVHGGSSTTIDPFLYTITLTIHPERKPEEALAALDTQLERMQNDLVTPEEIARAIKQARAMFAFGSENITNQAFWLGFAEMFATYDWFLTYLERLAAVTPEDVRRVAGQYFMADQRVIGIYLPDGSELDEE
ncbi:MAG: insulinase family protein [Chloroflexi bacterium HGW-Chloroflexi-6]|nr:MAG: insulinase family protein [Chloroflexi bacterium HGW-Chloroflexi-6]